MPKLTYEELVDMLCSIGIIQEKLIADMEFFRVEVLKSRADAIKAPKLKEDKRTRILIEKMESAQGEAHYVRNKLFDHFKEHKDSAGKKRVSKYD